MTSGRITDGIQISASRPARVENPGESFGSVTPESDPSTYVDLSGGMKWNVLWRSPRFASPLARLFERGGYPDFEQRSVAGETLYVKTIGKDRVVIAGHLHHIASFAYGLYDAFWIDGELMSMASVADVISHATRQGLWRGHKISTLTPAPNFAVTIFVRKNEKTGLREAEFVFPTIGSIPNARDAALEEFFGQTEYQIEEMSPVLLLCVGAVCGTFVRLLESVPRIFARPVDKILRHPYTMGKAADVPLGADRVDAGLRLTSAGEIRAIVLRLTKNNRGQIIKPANIVELVGAPETGIPTSMLWRSETLLGNGNGNGRRTPADLLEFVGRFFVPDVTHRFAENKTPAGSGATGGPLAGLPGAFPATGGIPPPALGAASIVGIAPGAVPPVCRI